MSELRAAPSIWPLDGDAMEARVTRKLQLRILPFAMLLYLVSFLDRLNVGFAALTMNKAIGLTPAMFGLGGGLFFVGYITVQMPSNLLLLRVGARVWIARVVIAWGIVSMASAFVVGPLQLLCDAIAAGSGRVGIFSGHAALSEPVVPCAAARGGDCGVHGGSAAFDGDRLADFRRADGVATICGAGELAVALHY